MARSSDTVMDMVRKELEKNPDASNEALFEKAKKLDSSVSNLTVRQFHARYPLQVKRLKALARKRRAGKRSSPSKAAAPRTGSGRRKRAAGATQATAPAGAAASDGSRKRTRRAGRKATAAPAAAGGQSRDAVRSLLLQFASDVAGAEGKADVVKVIGRVDSWVDRLLKAAAA